MEGKMSLELMKKLYKMQQSQEGTDCCFVFEEKSEDSEGETEVVPMYAHKLILSAASPVFKTMFSEKWAKDENIVIKNGSYSSFEALIKAIYVGRLQLRKEKDVLELYSLAHFYQVDEVLERLSNHMIKMSRYYPGLIVPYLNHACLYKNTKLKEACIKQIRLYADKVLEASSFPSASIEVINLIFTLDPLNIESDTDLITALQTYLEANPEARPQLDDAIHNIRFLSLEDDEIKECQFLETKIKDRLVILKKVPNLPMNNLPTFTKNRNPRADYKIMSTLPNNVVLKLYELFNDRYCFLCKATHSSFSCNKVLATYEGYKNLGKIYKDNFSHTCLERYTNDHIMAILRTLNILAIDEISNKTFDIFLDLV